MCGEDRGKGGREGEGEGGRAERTIVSLYPVILRVSYGCTKNQTLLLSLLLSVFLYLNSDDTSTTLSNFTSPPLLLKIK